MRATLCATRQRVASRVNVESVSLLSWIKRVLGGPSHNELDRESLSAAAIYPLLVDPGAWIHRRVETAEFVDDRLVRRRVSFDFTVPQRVESIDTGELLFLPLTLLRKGPLRNFDLDAADGQAIPVLTKPQNEVVAAESLTAIGETVAGVVLSAEVRESLFRVVAESPDDADEEIRRWSDFRHGLGPSAPVWNSLVSSEPFMDYARALAASFVLLIAAPPEPGARRVVKLGYDEEPGSEPELLKRVGSSLGWRRTPFRFEASAVSLCASYHFELASPPDLEIAGARLDIYPPGQPKQQHVDLEPGSRAHLYVAGVEPGAKGEVVVDVHARRSGLVRASLFVAAVSFALLLGGYFRLDAIGDPAQTQTATGLLLLVPTFLAAYIVKPGEHQLASALLLGVRVLMTVAALSAIYAAALLAGGVGDSKHFGSLWLIALTTSGLCTLGLIVSYVRPNAHTPSDQ